MSNIDDVSKNLREKFLEVGKALEKASGISYDNLNNKIRNLEIVKPIPMTKKGDIESMVEIISATEAKEFLKKNEEVNLNRFIEEFNKAVSDACKAGKNYVKFSDYTITQKKRELLKGCGYDITYDMQSDETLVSW